MQPEQRWGTRRIGKLVGCSLLTLGLVVGNPPVLAQSSQTPVTCDVLVVGGGMAGVATAYTALQAGRTVCLTEITDWIGGQVSAQGTSALDERPTQRSRRYFPQGYLEFRQRILARYDDRNPGDCWVSQVCFFPKDGHEILLTMLTEAAQQGRGTLRFFPNTVVKSLQIQPMGQGQQIRTVRGIQHRPAPGSPPLNTYPLSQTLSDSYSEQNSARLHKTLLQFGPPASGRWMVVEATETGELLALADLPYRLGVDPQTIREPSASSPDNYPYCPQAFTYPFAIAATPTPIVYPMPDFYPRYAQAYSYNLEKYATNPELVFTYRRIWSVVPGADARTVNPGDISMQNWNWGNDYGPGTATDNLIYTQAQLRALGQLNPNGWQGGLRVDSLRGGEEQALGFFYWLLAGTMDAQLGKRTQKPFPNSQYLQGLESPMGTVHGLSKYPYMREGRRLIGRYGVGYLQGFGIEEIDFSRKNYREDYYPEVLGTTRYQQLAAALAGWRAIAVIRGQIPPERLQWRARSRLYPDSVGIGHYSIDFHPCMELSPPERPGNRERSGERQGADEAYPFQIPLRAMIPPRIDNLLVTGKSLAMSHITAAAYRVHSIEWSAGAAAGETATFCLELGCLPYQLVQTLPRSNPELEALQRRLQTRGNPTAFPGTSILNQRWQQWD